MDCLKNENPNVIYTEKRIISKDTKILTRIAAVLYSLVILFPMIIIFFDAVTAKIENKNIEYIAVSAIGIFNAIFIVKNLICGKCYGRNMMIAYLIHCALYIFVVLNGYYWIEQDIIGISFTLASFVFLFIPALYFQSFSRLSFLKSIQHMYYLPIVTYIISFALMCFRLFYDIQIIKNVYDNNTGDLFFILLNYAINILVTLLVFANYTGLLFIIISLTVEYRSRVKENERCKIMEEVEPKTDMVQEKYLVEKIYEADYGCEERPVDYIPMDTVYLKSEDGNEIVIQMSDQELYDRNINEGDWIEYHDLQ